MEGALMDLLAVGSALVASVVFGVTKKYTGVLDGAFGTLVKPLQPALVAVAGIGIPVLAHALHLTTAVDASTFIAAPTATILAVTLREVATRIRKPTP